MRVKALIFAYFLVVLVCAFAYWLCWSGSPDVFIVHEEMNLTPIIDLRFLQSLDYPTGELPATEIEPESLDVLNDISRQKYSECLKLASQVLSLEKQVKIEEAEYDEAQRRFAEALEEKYDAYFEESMRGLYETRDVLTSRVSELQILAEDTKDPYELLYINSEISDVLIELSSVNLSIANEEYELAREHLEERGKFLDPVLKSELEKAYNSYHETRLQLDDMRDRYFQMRGEIYNAWVTMYGKRVRRLGFIDFLYFSLSVSVSQSFGDILPNHTVTRVLVILQLLCDILIVGSLVAIIAERITGSPHLPKKNHTTLSAWTRIRHYSLTPRAVVRKRLRHTTHSSPHL